jgi:hypothetical protein
MKAIDTPLGTYRWVENWITIPDSSLGSENGRTHGVAVLSSGEIVIFQQANPAVLFFSPEGDLLRAWGDFPGAHGLTVVIEEGQERLWATWMQMLPILRRQRAEPGYFYTPRIPSSAASGTTFA